MMVDRSFALLRDDAARTALCGTRAASRRRDVYAQLHTPLLWRFIRPTHFDWKFDKRCRLLLNPLFASPRSPASPSVVRSKLSYPGPPRPLLPLLRHAHLASQQ